MPNVTQTILVVDDDPLIREALRRQLRKAGYAMTAAESGNKALECAAASVADLVILDLRMPGMNGFETCRALKALKGWESVPVLILTGGQDDADYEGAIAAGADDFLTKPVVFQELMLRIRSLLRIRDYLADLHESVATIKDQREVILRDKAMRDKLEAFLLHDLKNPISNILLQAEMKVDLSPEGSEASAEWGNVLNHAEHLMELVGSWMDVLKSESVGLHLRPADVDARLFLEGLVKRHMVWLQVRHLAGAVQVEDGIGELRLDPAIMERVLSNLMENCIRYSPEGGEILLEARRTADRRLRLEVSDQGPGIPESLRESIFDMYVQLEAASTRRPAREGRGLGLAFCRMAVEAHGGHIWVEARPAGGSRFVIEVPA